MTATSGGDPVAQTIAAGALFMVIAQFFRSTWRRWTASHDTRTADQLREMRGDLDKMRTSLDSQLSDIRSEQRETKDTVGTLSDRVSTLEGIVSTLRKA